MSDRFTWWRNALSGSLGLIHENDPQPGYYRMRDGKGGAFVPVAIWHDGSGLNALRRGRQVNPCSVWTWCCREPVAYETYVAVAERGEPWPDEAPAIGHNSAALGLAPSDRLAGDIAALWTAARDWLAQTGEIATQLRSCTAKSGSSVTRSSPNPDEVRLDLGPIGAHRTQSVRSTGNRGRQRA